ncbi:hypothetical protein ACJD0Z_14385 [Flavobacteriaceae bacterium M23B6Z8]
MKVLLIYLKQRFNPAIFAGLTLLLILFSIPLPFNNKSVLLYVFPVFVLLAILRLYDDLMSYKVDAVKANRIYVHKESRNLLALILAGFTFLFLFALFFFHPILAGTMAVFLMLNDVLYRLLFRRGHSRYFLPLIKYPVIAVVLYYLTTSGFSWLLALCIMIALFFSFISFEILDDDSFPTTNGILSLCSNISVGAVIVGFGTLQDWWISVLILILGNLIIHYKPKGAAYIFIVFVLASKLVLEVVG